MKATFYCESTNITVSSVVRLINGKYYIDRSTLRRLFKRLGCDDVPQIYCDYTVYYSYPTLGRPYKEFKSFYLY